MSHWKHFFNRGKQALVRNNLRSALCSFNQAIKQCPLTESRELASLLYYTGIVLNKLGLRKRALQTWNISSQTDKNSHASSLIDHFCGLDRISRELLNDWNSFLYLKFYAYLQLKKRPYFLHMQELNQVRALILDYFTVLNFNEEFKMAPKGRKRQMIKDLYIDFPDIKSRRQEQSEILAFQAKAEGFQRLNCLCGSQIPQKLCCGKLSKEEIQIFESF